MVQRSDRAGFLLEAAQAVTIVGQGTRQDFDGDVALQPRVACAVNFAHTARAKKRLNLVRAKFCSRGESHGRATL